MARAFVYSSEAKAIVGTEDCILSRLRPRVQTSATIREPSHSAKEIQSTIQKLFASGVAEVKDIHNLVSTVYSKMKIPIPGPSGLCSAKQSQLLSGPESHRPKIAPVFLHSVPCTIKPGSGLIEINMDGHEEVKKGELPLKLPPESPNLFPIVSHVHQLSLSSHEDIPSTENLSNSLDISELPHCWTGVIGLLDKLEDNLQLGNCRESVGEVVVGDIAPSDPSLTKATAFSRKKRNVDPICKRSNMSLKRKSHITGKKDISRDGVDCVKRMKHSFEETDVDSAANFRNDVLWTEKYNPENTEQFIGNKAAIVSLKKWLSEWKLYLSQQKCTAASRQEKDDSSNDSVDCGLANCMLITGPSGIGKTAMVYALANELGFRVFEVNSSSQRTGRQILSRLKEVTQSHHLNQRHLSCGAHNTERITEQAAAESKFEIVMPSGRPEKNIVAHNSQMPLTGAKYNKAKPLKKFSQNITNTSAGKSRVASYGIDRFFIRTKRENVTDTHNSEMVSISQPTNKPIKTLDSFVLKEQKKNTDISGTYIVSRNAGHSGALSAASKGLTISSAAVILFDDVDDVLDDDIGFWSAVNSFIKTTKKPVILTASRNVWAVNTSLSEEHEMITLELPDLADILQCLETVCATEKCVVTATDLSRLVDHSGCDIRRCFLQLQLSTVTTMTPSKTVSGILHPSFLENGFLQNPSRHLLFDSGLYGALSLFLTGRSSQKVTKQQAADTLKNHLKLVSRSLPTNSLILGKKHSIAQAGTLSLSNQSRAREQALFCAVSHLSELSDFFSILDVTVHGMSLDNATFSSSLQRQQRWVKGLPLYPESDSVVLCSTDHISTLQFLLEKGHSQQTATYLGELMDVSQELGCNAELNAFDSDHVGLHHARLELSGLQNFQMLRMREKLLNTTAESLSPRHCLSRSAVSTDYIWPLRKICYNEEQRIETNTKRARRFLHYLNYINLSLENSARTDLQRLFSY